MEPFGSFVSNLFTRWGDLDISIEILTNSYISNTAKKQKQNLLRDVLKALRSKGNPFQDLDTIYIYVIVVASQCFTIWFGNNRS